MSLSRSMAKTSALLICTVENILPNPANRLATNNMAIVKETAAAQRIALAEKLLAEKIADVMTRSALEIEALCHLSIQELLIKLQPELTRGPEPGIHCVIVAAKVADSANEAVSIPPAA